MTDSKSNPVTRRYLLLATSGVAAVGVVGAAVPFVQSWTPSAKARALGAPIKVDISKLEPGEILGPIPAWRGQPVFVIHRTQAALEILEKEVDDLADPLSKKSTQPDYAVNGWRSVRPEIGVYLGLCTHLGCSPKYEPKVQPEPFDSSWKGGFFCPCHGSKFDLAGRVEKNLPAPTNLIVPPHRYETDSVIVIGEDMEIA
ncbi:MAG: ubiquinol-cytochrome c reductase iron-sulfur subunit [Gammaproteobacteria bacterium]|nr:ubiquinol-cytochrome c reductase iron-sulfur subunit [Gammaproteobacteria bacterium]